MDISNLNPFLSNYDFYKHLKNTVAGYHPNRLPMSLQEYKLMLNIAEFQIANGDYISVDEFAQKEN